MAAALVQCVTYSGPGIVEKGKGDDWLRRIPGAVSR